MAPVDAAIRTALATAVRYWDLPGARVVRRLPGSLALRCTLATDHGRFVLRQVRGDPAYLTYQVRVVRHLAGSGFPHRVPSPLPTRDGAPYASDGGCHWLLYAWIDGHPAPAPLTRGRIAAVAHLVGATERALALFDPGDRRGWFRLPLFVHARTGETVAGAARWLRDRHPRRRLARAVTAYGEAIVRGAADLPAASIAAVGALPAPTIYDDWHRRNLLAHGGRLVALIDFDSLVEAPRIVDVQNALTHLLAPVPAFRLPRLVAFARGLATVFPLTPAEAALVTTVMRDQLAALVAGLLDHVHAAGRFDAQARLALRLLGVGRWLLANEPHVTDALVAHATARHDVR